MAFEVVGLGLVAVELTRVQRRDLGTPRWLQRVENAGRRLTGRPAVRQVVGLDSAVAVDSAVGLRVWRGASVPDVDHRLAALEANVETLRDEGDQRHADLEKRVTQQSKRVDELLADVDRQHAEREGERREQLRESVTLQWWGTGLFVVGAILGGLANSAC